MKGQLLRATWIASLGSLGVALFGLVRGKVLAIYLGPDGFGVVAQMTTLVSLLANGATLGIGIGLTKLVAATRDTDQLTRGRAMVSRATEVITLAALTLTLIVVLFAQPIARLTLGSAADSTLVAIAAIAITPAALFPVLIAQLQGEERVSRVAVLLAGQALGLAILSTVGAVLGGRLGAVVALPVWYTGLGYYAWSRLHAAPQEMVRNVTLLHDGKEVLTLGALSFLVGTFSMLTDYAVRSVVVHSAGVTQAGLFIGAMALSNQYVSLLLGGLTNYTFPRLSRLSSGGLQTEVVAEVRQTVSFMLAIGFAAAMAVMVARHVIVRLVYAASFAPAAALIPILVVGDFLRVAGWATGIAFVPCGWIRAWAIVGIVGVAANLGAAFLAVPVIGARGAAFAYVLCWLLVNAMNLVVLGRKMGLALPSGLGPAIGASLLAIAGASFLALRGETVWACTLGLAFFVVMAARSRALTGLREALGWAR